MGAQRRPQCSNRKCGTTDGVTMSAATKPELPVPGLHLDSFKPYARGFATVVIALVGLLLCATVGSLAYPIGGIGVIFGGLCGCVIFYLMGSYATGFSQDTWDVCSATASSVWLKMPEPIAAGINGKNTIMLILTIHEAENVEVQGRTNLWNPPHLFVEVTSGNNPAHNTCVKKDAQWNERVKLVIAPFAKKVKHGIEAGKNDYLRIGDKFPHILLSFEDG